MHASGAVNCDACITRELTEQIRRRGQPNMIVSDDGTDMTSLGRLAPAVDANLNRVNRPASLELYNGPAQQALIATQSTERNRNGFYT